MLCSAHAQKKKEEHYAHPARGEGGASREKGSASSCCSLPARCNRGARIFSQSTRVSMASRNVSITSRISMEAQRKRTVSHSGSPFLTRHSLVKRTGDNFLSLLRDRASPVTASAAPPRRFRATSIGAMDVPALELPASHRHSRSWSATQFRQAFDSYFLGTARGQLFLLFIAAGICIPLGGAGLYVAVRASNITEDVEDEGFNIFLWNSYTYFVDPGTQTGLAPDDQAHQSGEVVMAVIVSLSGYVFPD